MREVSCTSCGHVFKMPDEKYLALIGKKVKCKACGVIFEVAAENDAAADEQANLVAAMEVAAASAAADDGTFAVTKQCPYCAETIKAEARKCRFCGSMLVAVAEPSVPQPWSPRSALNSQLCVDDHAARVQVKTSQRCVTLLVVFILAVIWEVAYFKGLIRPNFGYLGRESGFVSFLRGVAYMFPPLFLVVTAVFSLFYLPLRWKVIRANRFGVAGITGGLGLLALLALEVLLWAWSVSRV